jgi:hypothetical protein
MLGHGLGLAMGDLEPPLGSCFVFVLFLFSFSGSYFHSFFLVCFADRSSPARICPRLPALPPALVRSHLPSFTHVCPRSPMFALVRPRPSPLPSPLPQSRDSISNTCPTGPLRVTWARSDSLAGATWPSAWLRPCTRDKSQCSHSTPVPADEDDFNEDDEDDDFDKDKDDKDEDDKDKDDFDKDKDDKDEDEDDKDDGHACALPHTPRRGLQRLRPFSDGALSYWPYIYKPVQAATERWHKSQMTMTRVVLHVYFYNLGLVSQVVSSSATLQRP